MRAVLRATLAARRRARSTAAENSLLVYGLAFRFMAVFVMSQFIHVEIFYTLHLLSLRRHDHETQAAFSHAASSRARHTNTPATAPFAFPYFIASTFFSSSILSTLNPKISPNT